MTILIKLYMLLFETLVVAILAVALTVIGVMI